jgi:glycosyltransferase involved in cell wall biosynthesis
MKVLMLHNRYKISGGEDVSTEAEYNLLKKNGVDIEVLYLSNDDIEKQGKLSLAFNTIWSKKSYRQIQNKIEKEKYDLIHVQNFFPLFSPSIFYAAKRANTKIVMSVRNYRLICPNGLMYINHRICDSCVGHAIPIAGVLKKCYRDSYSASAVTASMLSYHNLRNTWNKQLDGFICISEFVKSQLQRGGIEHPPLFVKYNFVSTELSPNFLPGNYYVYAGRLSTEKGIDILLEAFSGSSRSLKIIGDGPLKHDVLQAADSNSNIQYLGKQSLLETYKIISQSNALIFPSKWHEPFGRTIVESFAHGTPVIGAALGGVTELIRDEYNGFLFDPKLPNALKSALDKFEACKDAVELRKNAFESYKDKFEPESNFKQIMEVYNRVLTSDSGKL